MFTSTHPRRVPDPDDPSTLMKEDGVALCSQMWIKNFCEPVKTVTNLTNYLRRFELWVLAYQKVCADEMGAYMPQNAIQRLEFFIKSPKEKEYESLSKRKIRAILTTMQPSSFQDRIVQEEECPHRVESCQEEFRGVLVVHKGRFDTILDGMKVGMVISALMRDVRDKKVIDLIKLALVTPVITTPHGEGEKKKMKRKYQKKRVLAEDEPKPDPYWLDTFFGFAPKEAEKLPSWGH
ncbi:hypothetical protein RHSIM_RhsimUnG0048900 [Rhododendron simsii]|uniref:Uncharacterized protein n=1 Tax=Rhododendron simsii TaxID=118357 RepID=A0A834FW01_RHOSS|nr:hypothetical protein RHSIM_RhsimUnG0048900 [Rhododendron simsii]